MRVIILYRPQSEHATAVESFVREFTRLHPSTSLQVHDADSRDGSHKAAVYDLQQYPSVLALSDDGQVLQSWSGEMLPLMNEVAYYANN